jgi:hypothetical protein
MKRMSLLLVFVAGFFLGLSLMAQVASLHPSLGREITIKKRPALSLA